MRAPERNAMSAWRKARKRLGARSLHRRPQPPGHAPVGLRAFESALPLALLQ